MISKMLSGAMQRWGRAVGCLATGLALLLVPSVDAQAGVQGYFLASYAVKADGTVWWGTDKPIAEPLPPLNAQLVGIALHNAFYTVGSAVPGGYAEPDHRLWLAAADGGVFARNGAGFYGSAGNLRLQAPIVGITSLSEGEGYWLVASDGGIFAFGSAGFYGSTGGIKLRKPVVGMASTPTGRGYWLVAADGGVFTFGDASFHGSAAGRTLSAPIVSIAPSRRGGGYYLLARDGSIFRFGDAEDFGQGRGSSSPATPVLGTNLACGTYGGMRADGTTWTARDNSGTYCFGPSDLSARGPYVAVSYRRTYSPG